MTPCEQVFFFVRSTFAAYANYIINLVYTYKICVCHARTHGGVIMAVWVERVADGKRPSDRARWKCAWLGRAALCTECRRTCSGCGARIRLQRDSCLAACACAVILLGVWAWFSHAISERARRCANHNAAQRVHRYICRVQAEYYADIICTVCVNVFV